EFRRVLFRSDLKRAVAHPGESRAQSLVPFQDLVETSLQRGYVQCSVQANRRGDVVKNIVGFVLIEKPEALLRKRERSSSGHGRRWLAALFWELLTSSVCNLLLARRRCRRNPLFTRLFIGERR